MNAEYNAMGSSLILWISWVEGKWFEALLLQFQMKVFFWAADVIITCNSSSIKDSESSRSSVIRKFKWRSVVLFLLLCSVHFEVLVNSECPVDGGSVSLELTFSTSLSNCFTLPGTSSEQYRLICPFPLRQRYSDWLWRFSKWGNCDSLSLFGINILQILLRLLALINTFPLQPPTLVVLPRFTGYGYSLLGSGCE